MDIQTDFNHRVFSINEAAAHLRISRSFLYAIINEQRLKPIKLGARAVVTGAEISKFLANAASAAPPDKVKGKTPVRAV